MKIIDAYWEKRNIGVTTVEIVVDRDDGIEVYEKERETIDEYEYSVIKIPIDMPQMVNVVQNEGYRFIESAIVMFQDVAHFSIPDKVLPLYRCCKTREMEKPDIEEMYSQIRKGIFRTDRIILDDYFNMEVSRERYVNWMKDMIDEGRICYKVLYQEKAIGFFLFDKNSKNEYHGILSGVYDGYEKIGLGMVVAIAETELIRNLGGNLYYTHFSSNNLANIRIHESLGFVIEKISNVFVRHRR